MAQHRTVYTDPATPAELRDDCRAAGVVLDLPRRMDSVARAAARPAPSIRFEDYPRGLPKHDIDMLTAARTLATVLDLELD
jgi:hypothetical protein